MIPIFTPYAREGFEWLLERGINARYITWPTVPRGKERIRVVVNAGRTREEVNLFVRSVVEWAKGIQEKMEKEGERGDRERTKL